jgi:hypothetical protein
MKIVCVAVALLAWCGAMWINVLAVKQARAAGSAFGLSIQKRVSLHGEDKTFRSF